MNRIFRNLLCKAGIAAVMIAGALYQPTSHGNAAANRYYRPYGGYYGSGYYGNGYGGGYYGGGYGGGYYGGGYGGGPYVYGSPAVQYRTYGGYGYGYPSYQTYGYGPYGYGGVVSTPVGGAYVTPYGGIGIGVY